MIKNIALSLLISSIFFTYSSEAVRKSRTRYSSDEDSIGTQTSSSAERPTWDNDLIKNDLANIFKQFYSTPENPTLKKIGNIRRVINFNQLYVTTDINKVKEGYKEFGIIPLRDPSKDTLILSCGNYFTDTVGSGNFCPAKVDSHTDADTVDLNVGMNPSIIANLSQPGFYTYLKNINKTYQTIIAEGGYTLHDLVHLEKLKDILAVGGNYKINIGLGVSVVDENRAAASNNLSHEQAYQSLIVTVPHTDYENLRSNQDPKFVTSLIKEKMTEMYKEQGFSFDIKNPQHFLLSMTFSSDDISHFSINRSQVERSEVSLKRER